MTSFGDIGEVYQFSAKEILSAQLNEFDNIAKELFENIVKGYAQRGSGTTSNCISQLTDKLVAKDAQIKTSVKQALIQVEKDEEINKVKEELMKTENELLLLQSNLKEAESLLATGLFQASKKLETSEQAKKASIRCEELIKFAFRISSGNSVEAPPDWIPGDPRRPYPLDIEMRCGALGQLSQKLPRVSIEQQSGTDQNITVANISSQHKELSNMQDTLMSANEGSHGVSDNLAKNGAGIWQGPPADDFAHLATMPVSAMMSNPSNSTNNLNGRPNVEDVGYMSTSSDSSSSGESM